MEDQLAQLLGSGTLGGIVVWVVKYLFDKKAQKLDIESQANQMLTEFTKEVNAKLKEVEAELDALAERCSKLNEQNIVYKVQLKLYEQHLDKCGKCDQTQLLRIGQDGEINPANN